MKRFLMLVVALLVILPLATGCPKSTGGKDTGLAAERDAFLNGHVHFDYNRYNIRPDAAQILNAKAAYLGSNASLKTELQGHTDSRGTEAYNMALGDRRAQSARSYLVNKGIEASRMTTVSYGKERPLDASENEAAWARNRRVQFIITAE